MLVLSAAFLTACEKKPTETTPAAQIANPASVYCAGRGGQLEIVNEVAGQVGYCVLPDGRRVEEWTLFRAAQAANPPDVDTSE